MANATQEKFGDPDTRLRAFEHWVVLLRPAQVTLGSLVLVCTEPQTAFSALSPGAFAELHEVTSFVEQRLTRVFAYDKINYLMLMMVDPDVHFHVFPRYESSRTFAGQAFVDEGWPGPPNLKAVNATEPQVNREILEALATHS